VCGILAVIGNEFRYEEVPNSIIDRGIDSHGVYVDTDVQLIQTRLQITGKDNIVLPLQYQQYVLLYNGEIYNYKEVNKHLTEFEFKYDSDFETVLFSYIKWGNKCTEMLDGQYAFLVWDKDNKQEHVFVDPFKIRTLYYQEKDDCRIYSSNLSSMPDIIFDKTHATGFGNVTNSRIL
jgi:asparagine synthase (glutamine-hydrolysing)